MTGPTFGETLRGARLGFRWHEKLKVMIRMTVVGELFRIHLCHPSSLPTGAKGEKFVCWWESKEDLPMMSSAIRNVQSSAISGSLVLYVDDNGNRVEAGL